MLGSVSLFPFQNAGDTLVLANNLAVRFTTNSVIPRPGPSLAAQGARNGVDACLCRSWFADTGQTPACSANAPRPAM